MAESVVDQLRNKTCPQCGIRIMSVSYESACVAYNHVAWKSNLLSQIERCRINPFVKSKPTISQLDNGEWQVVVGMAGFKTEHEARTFWAFARKNDDWDLVSGEIIEQQANGYGQSWPKERI